MNPRVLHECDQCENQHATINAVSLCDDCYRDVRGIAAERAAFEEMEGMKIVLEEACRAFLAQLDYLRELWGDEGVTRSIADKARNAIACVDSRKRDDD